MSKLKIFILFSVISSFLGEMSHATTFDREYIKSFAKDFVLQHLATPKNGKIVITPADIDPRIAIKPCDIPLTANIPEKYSSRNVNIKISCASSKPWHIFLPVNVETTIPVLVTKNNIGKGSILTNENLTIQWRPLHKIRGEVIDDMNLVVGAKSKRSLSKGSVLNKRSICVVCKGDKVTIVAKSSNFMIKTNGTALKNATFGEQVRVKNSRSGRTITAQVYAINQVVINL